jgi:hypothetical protein
VAAFGAAATSAAATTKPVDLRVLTHTGKTLADFRQYTGTVKARTTHKADCFGKGNRSHDRTYTAKGTTLLGALVDGARHDSKLNPLLLTDAFVKQGFGLGVCGIGGFETKGLSFWYAVANHRSASTGADLTPLHAGDEALYYLTSGNEKDSPPELALSLPARARPGVPVRATVRAYDPGGKATPAEGAELGHGAAPTDAGGHTEIAFPSAGRSEVQATLGEDIPSRALSVCVNADVSKCPAHFGRRIFGSDAADRIATTPGHDVVNCGKGRDVVIRSAGDDRIARNCERVING